MVKYSQNEDFIDQLLARFPIVTWFKDENGKVRLFQSNRLPELKVKTQNIERTLGVTFSSVESEDNELLHSLLTKTRNSPK